MIHLSFFGDENNVPSRQLTISNNRVGGKSVTAMEKNKAGGGGGVDWGGGSQLKGNTEVVSNLEKRVVQESRRTPS